MRFIVIFLIYIYYGGGHRHMLQCTRVGQDNFWKRVLSFHLVGPRHGTQVTRLGGQHRYLLTLAKPLN